MKNLLRSLALLGALLLLTTGVLAAEFSGVVRDPNGASIPGARIVIQSATGGPQRTTSTDSHGRFRVETGSGSFELRVEATGFAPYRQAVEVRHRTGDIEVVLKLVGLQTEVSVSAEIGQAIETERATQRVNVISEEEIASRAATTLAAIAREEVGVSQQRTSPTIGAVLVRGLNDVGVYVDGVRWTQSTQRGGINTFFNLNEPTAFETAEVLRGPNGAQYGSDSLAGTVALKLKPATLGLEETRVSGAFNTQYATEDNGIGSNLLLNLGSRRFGLTADIAGRRVSDLRPGGGIDTHAAITRFLGLPSTIFSERLPDTAFTQYGGMVHASILLSPDQQLSVVYQRGQQDGAKRYDQLLGGDGNLIADLRNLMLDFGYVRYQKQRLGWFDYGAFTVSLNSQREERVNQGGQGNALAAIIRDRERTTTWGFSFYADKRIGRHSFLTGADLYRDGVRAPSFSFDPVTGIDSPARPRVPNGSRFLQYGFFAQDGWDAISGRLRFSSALRYNVASYRARSSDAPIVGGTPLFPDDSMRVGDLSGRAGAVLTVFNGGNVAFNYSRGFRAPNVTALGSVGLVGVGYQVAASELRGTQAFIGNTADATAVSTGERVMPLKSEYTNGYDINWTVRRGLIYASVGGFWIRYSNTISRQTLILDPGAVGTLLGSQPIVQQDPSGAVYVPLSTSPVLVQVNFGGSQVRGVEAETKVHLTNAWSAGANYTYVYAEDDHGNPPNTEGGTLPPQTLNLHLRFMPKSRYWVEAYGTLAGRQDRLSSLGLSDRRTGATRTRAQIQNFFFRGATVRGLVGPGPDGLRGNADDVLLPTGETVAQVQQRVLGSANSAPLFRYLPGYGIFGIRGGVQLSESSKIVLDFENIGDKNYRNASWGMPGPGRALALRYNYKF